MQVRSVQASDAADIQAIYAPYVRETAISFEAEPPSEAEMATRIAGRLSDALYLVAEADGAVLGYAYAGRYRTRHAYARTVEVSAYVAEAAHGRGVGRALYGALLEALRAAEYRTAIAIVTLPNAPSVAFHQAMGFTHAGTLKDVGYKFGRWHDTSRWQIML